MTSSEALPMGSARERLLDAAAMLFYSDGIVATGIDAIVKRAGVAKKSLYNNFDSKAALVAAYMEARHSEWLALYETRMTKAFTPVDRVLAVFLAYQDHAEWAYERGFRGCGLLNAAAELPAGHEGRDVVLRHKRQVESLLTAPLEELIDDEARASRLARQLAFLLEGAMVRAGLEGHSRCVREAHDMAWAMVTAS
ncbi:transcriptional regulator, TetR family [Kushneria avicenniae]|uniref:Transcriptional regulator, TetR family n=1 Tax=Kushneria avicenniae TaxID=402385 RepID=A0A1I1N8B4_9GAMM|nr:TetR/AcrR family transcriptional regulator [Kushneria avicenniae]SFC91708.1 transcriptional regulator, TetR family [Kushneria avicenniae]